jgi:hypothetical protein
MPSLHKFSAGKGFTDAVRQVTPDSQRSGSSVYLAWAMANNSAELLKRFAARNGIFITKAIRKIPVTTSYACITQTFAS